MSSSTTSTRPPPSKKAEDAGPLVFFHLRAHIDLNHYNLPKHGPTPDFILDAHSRLTDIVRALVFRFEAFGRPVRNMKKFEEGVFSDLRNLKPGVDACLEEPKVRG